MAETEITKIDPTTYEFLKAKLSADIGSDVKNSLFRQYWTWIAGFSAGIAVLGLVSIGKIIPDVAQNTAERFIQNELAAPLKKAKDEIKDFETLVTTSREKFEKSFGETAFQSEQLKQSLANMKRYSEDTERDIRVVNSRILDNKKSVDDLRSDLIASIKKDLVTVPDFQAASNRVADIVAELLKIRDEIKALQKGQTPPATTQQEAARVATFQKIAQQDRASTPLRSATVFIQFAVMPRDTIRIFAAGLKDLGWTVPPEDREDAATGRKEVRYYYDEDAPKVTQLIADIARQIEAAGYKPVEFSATPLLNYPKKPKPGTLEVWVGVLPARL